MACLEHQCARCQYVWHDNTIWRRCPSCGSSPVTNYFDEDPLFEENDDDADETREDGRRPEA